MCGIIGVISASPLPKFENFMTSLNMMDHRGPDDYGQYLSNCNRVILGHKRLSIVELSALGKQPMVNNLGHTVLVFNGEIYNHNELRNELVQLGCSFKSKSDTEVILKSYEYWGKDCVKKFNGAFAFTLFDINRDIIIFARDRSGEKPFFYRYHDGCLYFSSDLLSLSKLCGDQAVFNPQSLASYLSIGYTLGGDSLIQDYLSVEPGSVGIFDLKKNTLDFTRYWEPKSQDQSLILSSNELTEKLEYLLSDAVRLQLNCDVPACVLLSGGVDSSLLTALASQHTNRVKTFTVTFPGHPAFDETDSARLIANHFGTDHTELEGVDVSPDLFLDIANKIDTPINDSSLIPTYLVNEAVSKHCRVALGGDGADELFGGYKHYSRLLKLNNYLGSGSHLLRSVKAHKLKGFIPKQYRARNWFDAIAHDLDFSVPNIREILDFDEVFSLLPQSISSKFDLDEFNKQWMFASSNNGSLVKNCCLSDFRTYLRESVLVKSDRCSMLNSVEGRAPFLDARLIDFAYQEVPDNLKTTTENRKIILKNLSEKLLPSSFDLHRKLGFNLPLGSMIKDGKWKQLVGDIMHSDCDFLSYDYRVSLFDKHMKGQNHTDKIFGIMLLIIWSKRNNVSLSS